MRIVDRCRGGGGTGIVPVILQKFNSQNTAASPFRASLATPRCLGESTIAGSTPIRRSHKLNAYATHRAFHLQRTDRADYSQ